MLAFAGLRCALFLHVPDAETLRELGPFDAIGMGGQMGQADYFVAALRGRPKPG